MVKGKEGDISFGGLELEPLSILQLTSQATELRSKTISVSVIAVLKDESMMLFIEDGGHLFGMPQ